MHGGCSAFLIDQSVLPIIIHRTVDMLTSCHTLLCSCSTLAIMLLDKSMGGPGRLGVSQSLNITYHAPALPFVLVQPSVL
jgi:hypothetical protein